MGFSVARVTVPPNARQIVEVDGPGTEGAARIKATLCGRCSEPIGLQRPFRSLEGGIYRHIDCAAFEGA